RVATRLGVTRYLLSEEAFGRRPGLPSTSARERRVLESVFAEYSRVALPLRGEELDADRYRGERAGEVSPDRVDHLSRRAVDRRVVHPCPFLSVRVEDDIDALHVAKVRGEGRDAQIVVRPYRALDRLAPV